ncbi:MAG: 30S ribosomal protein S8 [Candidatus Acidiferrales bacterium]|jgi:small subunit ribosomal protein S8|nr:30S ribosomal protein S8 [Candidatus Acidoferrales bacterium]HEV2341787.1 30S ribosomal protein S8 [Candidatus Acidoferrales bacterium]HKV28254.1 30S ribosomal protein S8 [Candidatus Acidoferrales bacterium]HVB35751.1 30S ribosomal protein S8 [Candidatus Acidoferrales bacterium]HXT73026.1 30S ribosomal protein S8 [Candidatus Angelobacter sp.]
MTTDPIADMLTRIRNAVRARHPRVDLPSSKMKIEIARILKEEGYVSTYKVVDENKQKVLRVFFRYTSDKRSVLTDLKRISRPGCRRYVGKTGIRPVVGGMGVAILSTPRGIMTGQTARKEGVGGELLCEVW